MFENAKSKLILQNAKGNLYNSDQTSQAIPNHFPEAALETLVRFFLIGDKAMDSFLCICPSCICSRVLSGHYITIQPIQIKVLGLVSRKILSSEIVLSMEKIMVSSKMIRRPKT